MDELDSEQRTVHRDRAIAQFFRLYREISRFAIVYLLPSVPGLQDQTYVSNLGVVLPHLADRTVVISRFRSPPRVGEAAVGHAFFEMMDFTVERPPKTLQQSGSDACGEHDREVYFEGEADLKYLVDNVYVGAHGVRTSRSAHRWLSESFGMKVIPFHLKNERLYHLDCCVLPISPEKTAVCTGAADKSTVAEIENHVEILDVPLEAALYGATNAMLTPNKILFSSNISELSESHDHYAGEMCKIDAVEQMGKAIGMDVELFNLSEFNKSGADLSCLIMNLNYREYLGQR
ncbi:MAG: dimethylarginine dimethylaminohydrolase family protein [Hyphomicrobiales bacterium]